MEGNYPPGGVSPVLGFTLIMQVESAESGYLDFLNYLRLLSLSARLALVSAIVGPLGYGSGGLCIIPAGRI